MVADIGEVLEFEWGVLICVSDSGAGEGRSVVAGEVLNCVLVVVLSGVCVGNGDDIVVFDDVGQGEFNSAASDCNVGDDIGIAVRGYYEVGVSGCG